MIFGISASFMIIQDNIFVVIIGAILLFYKNVLDKVDGSLARAKGLDSRRGRFYDSIADFVVTLTVFSAMGYKLLVFYQSILIIPVVFIAMIFSMLQCSYFIYYQVSFIKISGKNTVNRILEQVTDEDIINEDKITLVLQKIFMLIYGWQDVLMYKIDKWAYNRLDYSSEKQSFHELWYKDRRFLTIASLLSIGTHMVLIAICSIFKGFELYLFLNLIFLNLILTFCFIYHYKSVKNRIEY